jgi:hypothetical protein
MPAMNLRQSRRPAMKATSMPPKPPKRRTRSWMNSRPSRPRDAQPAQPAQSGRKAVASATNQSVQEPQLPATSRPQTSKSRTAQQSQKSQQPQHAENARRRAYTPEELQTEIPDTRTAESKSRLRFLPNFLRRREPELPQEERAVRPTEESLAGRSKRTARPAQRALPHDEERALPEENLNESLAKVAPKKASKAPASPAKSPKKENVEDWAAPWDQEQESVAQKPVHEKGRKAASEDSDLLESPFEQQNTEVSRKAPAVKKTNPSEKILFDDEKQEFADSLREKKTAPKADLEPKAAPKTAEIEKTAQLPVQEEFPNPFTEVAEKDADKTDREIKEENPFTGLKLETEKLAAAPKSLGTTAPAKVAEAKKEIAPKIQPQIAAPKPVAAPLVEAPKIAEVLKTPELPKLAEKDIPNPFLPEKAAELPNFEDPLQRAKVRRLSSRRGLAGLKGFCPVALRDRRDLVDTNPDITSIHDGKIYQLSSAEARRRSTQSPKNTFRLLRTDVIIQVNSHQTIDGTLDHAVWFHDKLYLFSSPESLEAFVLNPTEYAR